MYLLFVGAGDALESVQIRAPFGAGSANAKPTLGALQAPVEEQVESLPTSGANAVAQHPLLLLQGPGDPGLLVAFDSGFGSNPVELELNLPAKRRAIHD